jgi:hypothetical protein
MTSLVLYIGTVTSAVVLLSSLFMWIFLCRINEWLCFSVQRDMQGNIIKRHDQGDVEMAFPEVKKRNHQHGNQTFIMNFASDMPIRHAFASEMPIRNVGATFASEMPIRRINNNFASEMPIRRDIIVASEMPIRRTGGNTPQLSNRPLVGAGSSIPVVPKKNSKNNPPPSDKVRRTKINRSAAAYGPQRPHHENSHEIELQRNPSDIHGANASFRGNMSTRSGRSGGTGISGPGGLRATRDRERQHLGDDFPIVHRKATIQQGSTPQERANAMRQQGVRPSPNNPHHGSLRRHPMSQSNPNSARLGVNGQRMGHGKQHQPRPDHLVIQIAGAPGDISSSSYTAETSLSGDDYNRRSDRMPETGSFARPQQPHRNTILSPIIDPMYIGDEGIEDIAKNHKKQLHHHHHHHHHRRHDRHHDDGTSPNNPARHLSTPGPDFGSPVQRRSSTASNAVDDKNKDWQKVQLDGKEYYINTQTLESRWTLNYDDDIFDSKPKNASNSNTNTATNSHSNLTGNCDSKKESKSTSLEDVDEHKKREKKERDPLQPIDPERELAKQQKRERREKRDKERREKRDRKDVPHE